MYQYAFPLKRVKISQSNNESLASPQWHQMVTPVAPSASSLCTCHTQILGALDQQNVRAILCPPTSSPHNTHYRNKRSHQQKSRAKRTYARATWVTPTALRGANANLNLRHQESCTIASRSAMAVATTTGQISLSNRSIPHRNFRLRVLQTEPRAGLRGTTAVEVTAEEGAAVSVMAEATRMASAEVAHTTNNLHRTSVHCFSIMMMARSTCMASLMVPIAS